MTNDAFIDIVGGPTYHGKTVWSIVRRVWGRSKAIHLRKNRDPNSPTWGYVLIECETGGYNVLASVYDLDGPMGINNEGVDVDEEIESWGCFL